MEEAVEPLVFLYLLTCRFLFDGLAHLPEFLFEITIELLRKPNNSVASHFSRNLSIRILVHA